MSSSPTETNAPTGRDAGQPTGTVPVEMPKMGISVSEGTIVEWRKRSGDWVEADETIADVTTDKVDVEIPAPATGRVARLAAEPGETVAVGTVIAEIDPEARPDGTPDTSPSGRRESPSEASGSPAASPGSEAAGRHAAQSNGERDRSTFYSPVVRRMAAMHGVDLSQVEGTGVGGRIRKKDVLAYLERRGSEGGARGEPHGGRPLHIESPYRPDEPAGAPAAAPVGNGNGSVTLLEGRHEPMSPMRKAIARHMVESRRTAAHCTTIVEVNMSRVAARRGELKEQMARRGVRLTYLAFVAKAVVEGLGRHPILNSSIEGEEIVWHDTVNLGIAVALDDGLIVPVIPHAERLSLEGLAAAIGDVADRARAKRLDPDEVHGGTFTITNPGQFGAVLATPIINRPQVAILDLEAIVMRPVAVPDGSGGHSIAVRPMTYLPMSWDHRALDGAEAARFLASVKERLERWEGE